MGTARFGDRGFASVLESARVADELGIDLVVLPDHVVMHGAARDAREGFPYPIDADWYDPLIALSAIAAVTRSCRLGMNALVAPLRPAVLLAKQLATLDAVSGGRVEATLGVGWQAEEYAAAERAFEGRFGMLEEQLAACRALWRGGPSAYHGTRIDFDDLYSQPLPPQGEQMPIFLALGLSDRNRERILRHGTGWAPAPMPIEQFRESVVAFGAAPDASQASGRSGRTDAQGASGTAIRITAAVTLSGELEGSPVLGHPLQEAEALWDAGAETVIVHPSRFVGSPDGLARFLAPILSARDARNAQVTPPKARW
ncbi:TIGR03619 family F420-dependent LLM class oxidoreductase [Herbiconiux sp. P17]|uniref:TIGR03619 family F420-dependent LLM class oxidoreductase n=1 Tax=Herbiconiux wuyangfengii TaxID=3342794 RepID=UPI0035B6DF79